MTRTRGLMYPETFPHHQAAHDYARAHGLEYAWEGTAAFEERVRTLPPEQYEITAVHTPKAMTWVMLFSKTLPM
jgi:hypothetical protein